MKAVVGIIMGSDSDLSVMKEANEFLTDFGVPASIDIVSAHRTTKRMFEFAAMARKNGIKVIIAGAGGAAHLPGMVASLTPLPVIGVPIKTKAMGGLDSLLSITQMPPGVPVATVAVNGAKNAAILACQILAVGDPVMFARVEEYKKNLESSVLRKAQSLRKIGLERYLRDILEAK